MAMVQSTGLTVSLEHISLEEVIDPTVDWDDERIATVARELAGTPETTTGC